MGKLMTQGFSAVEQRLVGYSVLMSLVPPVIVLFFK
jgi:hypothetical protein